jgi:hypothetical protein
MRIITLFLCLLGSFAHTEIFAADAASSADLSKAEFSKAIPLAKGAQKLLESSGERLYFSTVEGSVAVTDLDGKLIQTL